MQIKEIEFEDQGPKISEKELVETESEIGFSFPKDYRDFLLLFNGGWSKICLSTNPWLAVCQWWSIGTDFDIESPFGSILKGHQNSKELQGEYIEIGQCYPTGDMLVMKMRNPNQFAIGVFEHDTSKWDQFQFYFSSFSDMISHMRKVEIAEYKSLLRAMRTP